MAVAFAAIHPDRSKALVLCNTAAQMLNSKDYPFGIAQEAGDVIVAFREASWGTEECWFQASAMTPVNWPGSQNI